MSKVHCVPHETGISFTYDGVYYVYNAEGFWHLDGEGGLQSLDESDVPLIVCELTEHWQSFNLRVRVDNLVGWLSYCDVCDEEYRVFVHAGLNYRGVRLVERHCCCGVERYSGWAARRGTGPRPTLEYVQVLAANVRGLWAAGVFRFGGEIAGETRSDARVASEGPRATFQATFFVWIERSRGTGPRATVTVAFPLGD